MPKHKSKTKIGRLFKGKFKTKKDPDIKTKKLIYKTLKKII